MEQRTAARIPAQARARCRSQGVVIEGRVEDVSRSGLFLRACSSLQEGSAAELDLELPGEKILHLAVEVVRVVRRGEGVGMGLRFVGQAARRRTLANFIMQQAAR